MQKVSPPPRSKPPLVEPLEKRVLLATNVLTWHYDNGRTGQVLTETNLTPSNVNVNSFGKAFTQSVDGFVYAQPLVMSGVAVPNKGVHNVLLVATEHDSVYAFDADSRTGSNALPLWKDSFINPGRGVDTVPSEDTGSDDLIPEVGITSTPVIDAASGTMYVLAKTKETARSGAVTYVQRLHALNIATGRDILPPIAIAFTQAGNGDGSSGGALSFNALIEHQRCALLLSNGVVYVTWASHGDTGPYHGWIAGYSTRSFRMVGLFDDTPNGSEGGIWMDGAGPATDASGNLFLATGNGTFSANTGGSDYADSALKLSPGTLSPLDYFTPSNQQALSDADLDLGSGGVLVVPAQRSTTTPNMIIFGGKQSVLYVANRDNLGHFNSNNQVVQEINGAFGTAIFATPAYFNGNVYLAGIDTPLRRLQFQRGSLVQLESSPDTYQWPGASPVISANGSRNGIVWTLTRGTAEEAVLSAYNAGDISHLLYSNSQSGSRGVAGQYVKFTTPVVANGKVYVSTQTGIAVYSVLTRSTPSAQSARQPLFTSFSLKPIPADTRPTGDQSVLASPDPLNF